MWMRSTKTFNYALEKLGKSNFGFERTAALNLKAKDTRVLGTSLLIIPELRVLETRLRSGQYLTHAHSRITRAVAAFGKLCRLC